MRSKSTETGATKPPSVQSVCVIQQTHHNRPMRTITDENCRLVDAFRTASTKHLGVKIPPNRYFFRNFARIKIKQ